MLLVVDCGSTKTPEFARIATNANVASQMVTMAAFPSLELSDYSHIIVSGAPILVTEVNPVPYLQLFKGLLTANCPILGVCFGHQISGMLHGATPARCPEDRSWRVLEMHVTSALFEGVAEPVSMMQDHCECIDVPTDWHHLASSEICQNEAMKHPEKNWYGVQFHPEVSDASGIRLLENFLAL